MQYTQLPRDLGKFSVVCDEMMFYQYLPIKLKGIREPTIESRLLCFCEIIEFVCAEFIKEYGLKAYKENYIYLTAKKMYQTRGTSFNRKGFHSDGFMTDDINYVWSDKNPTVFNNSNFKLTLDDNVSMLEMESQADKRNDFFYPNETLLRLNQYNIHKVFDGDFEGFRTFLKLSFSKDKYDLKGNSKNYSLDYDWEMRDREIKRNIPQKLK